MLKPLEQFICDSCRQTIETPDHGWVEWVGEGNRNHGFRICHDNGRCPRLSKNEYLCDQPLSSFLGDYKWKEFYSFLDDAIQYQILLENFDPSDFQELSEFIKRLTVPYYEEARQFIDQQQLQSNNYMGLRKKDLKNIIDENK